MRKKIFALAILVAIFGVGCSKTDSDGNASGVTSINESDLALRKGDLFTEDEVSGAEANYSSAAPGTSTKFERSFTNAPPMIPHEIKDMLPITIKNNQCISCHDRESAKDMKAAMPNLTSIPDTHYRDLRSKDQKDLGHLAGLDLTAFSVMRLRQMLNLWLKIILLQTIKMRVKNMGLILKIQSI